MMLTLNGLCTRFRTRFSNLCLSSCSRFCSQDAKVMYYDDDTTSLYKELKDQYDFMELMYHHLKYRLLKV